MKRALLIVILAATLITGCTKQVTNGPSGETSSTTTLHGDRAISDAIRDAYPDQSWSDGDMSALVDSYKNLDAFLETSWSPKPDKLEDTSYWERVYSFADGEVLKSLSAATFGTTLTLEGVDQYLPAQGLDLRSAQALTTGYLFNRGDGTGMAPALVARSVALTPGPRLLLDPTRPPKIERDSNGQAYKVTWPVVTSALVAADETLVSRAREADATVFASNKVLLAHSFVVMLTTDPRAADSHLNVTGVSDASSGKWCLMPSGTTADQLRGACR